MAATTTTLRIDGVSKVGDTLQATATVTGSSPTGNVVLKDKTTTLGIVSLIAGVGTFTVANLSYGSHPLWVSYAGDGPNDPSVSPTVLHTVHKAGMFSDLTTRVPTLVTHEQADPATTWTITHNFGGYPMVDVYVMYEGELNKIIPSGITYVDENTVQVNFTIAYAGYATVV